MWLQESHPIWSDAYWQKELEFLTQFCLQAALIVEFQPNQHELEFLCLYGEFHPTYFFWCWLLELQLHAQVSRNHFFLFLELRVLE